MINTYLIVFIPLRIGGRSRIRTGSSCFIDWLTVVGCSFSAWACSNTTVGEFFDSPCRVLWKDLYFQAFNDADSSNRIVCKKGCITNHQFIFQAASSKNHGGSVPPKSADFNNAKLFLFPVDLQPDTDCSSVSAHLSEIIGVSFGFGIPIYSTGYDKALAAMKRMNYTGPFYSPERSRGKSATCPPRNGV